MRVVILTPAASYELGEAFDWYEFEVTGLGHRFLAEVDAVMERMTAYPRQFPVVHKSIRRALLRHFPHALFFVTEPDESLTVIACFHASRNPVRWMDRESPPP